MRREQDKESFGNLYGLAGLPCQFEINCAKGTIFYKSGQATLPFGNYIEIVGTNIQRKENDYSGGVTMLNCLAG